MDRSGAPNGHADVPTTDGGALQKTVPVSRAAVLPPLLGIATARTGAPAHGLVVPAASEPGAPAPRAAEVQPQTEAEPLPQPPAAFEHAAVAEIEPVAEPTTVETPLVHFTGPAPTPEQSVSTAPEPESSSDPAAVEDSTAPREPEERRDNFDAAPPTDSVAVFNPADNWEPAATHAAYGSAEPEPDAAAPPQGEMGEAEPNEEVVDAAAQEFKVLAPLAGAETQPVPAVDPAPMTPEIDASALSNIEDTPPPAAEADAVAEPAGPPDAAQTRDGEGIAEPEWAAPPAAIIEPPSDDVPGHHYARVQPPEVAAKRNPTGAARATPDQTIAFADPSPPSVPPRRWLAEARQYASPLPSHDAAWPPADLGDAHWVPSPQVLREARGWEPAPPPTPAPISIPSAAAVERPFAAPPPFYPQVPVAPLARDAEHVPAPRDGFLKRARRNLRRAVRWGIAAAAAYVFLVMGLILVYRYLNPPASTLMVLRMVQGEGAERTWVPLEEISPNLVRAVIVSEDGRFCQHWGVDLVEMGRALEQAGLGSVRGASTISMQVAKNLFLVPTKSVVRKAVEVPLALMIDYSWPKHRTIEIYLNIAEWGPGVFGAEAAAQYHFGKSADRLSEREAALLAATLPNPITRVAGDPGPGTARLAGFIQNRMRGAGGVAACLGERVADRDRKLRDKPASSLFPKEGNNAISPP